VCVAPEEKGGKMARRKTQFIQGGYYHIYNRGAGRTPIFHDDSDYKRVLRGMKEYCLKFNIAIIAYCLMPNHYHWLVRQDSDISAHLLPQRVFNSYVKAFNLQYGRTGTLFEGPFKAKPVEQDDYLRHLCCYIHANPVKDGLVTTPDMWPYSNYLEWMGVRKGSLVDMDFVARFFPDVEQYQARVLDYLTGRVQLPENFEQEIAW